MLVIVGHGPSVVQRHLGAWLDTQTVVRLKRGERPNARDWGTRTDYLCAGSPSCWGGVAESAERWVLSGKPVPRGTWRQASGDWLDYYRTFAPEYHKPSTGLKAVFCAMEFLKPAEIGLLGFDRILHPDVPTSKWWHETGKYVYAHDAHAEHRCIHSLGVKLTEL